MRARKPSTLNVRYFFDFLSNIKLIFTCKNQLILSVWACELILLSVSLMNIDIYYKIRETTQL